MDGLPDAKMWLAGTDETDAGKTLSVEVEPDRLKEIKVFVSQPRDAVHDGSTHFAFDLADQDGSETAHKASEFFAPHVEHHNGNED